jgi:hypothetical protein
MRGTPVLRYAILATVVGLAACGQAPGKEGAKASAAAAAAPDTGRSRPRADTTLSGRAEPASPVRWR